MQQIHILHENYYNRNGEAFLFPLKYNQRRLKDYGIALRFYSRIVPSLTDCDVLCLSSRFFSSWWAEAGGSRIIQFLQQSRKGSAQILWFDLSDSTGTTHLRVLPHVDLYLKSQILKDRSAYQNVYYGSRLTTDFYHRKFDVQDRDSGPPHLNHVPRDKDLDKIQVGWHSGMTHHGRHGVLWGHTWHRMGTIVPRFYPVRWWSPSLKRPIHCSCRIGTSYTRETVAYARKEIKKRLSEQMCVKTISKPKYFKELTQSIAAVSPFGFGEICYRDFEIVISGAAMIKQQMNHVETWPDLWVENESYLPFAWDLSDLDETIEFVSQNPRKMVDLAKQAQIRYKSLLCTEEGHHEFCQHFAGIVADKNPEKA